MARFTKYLLFIAVLALWLAPGTAFAGVYDVAQGTLISNTCTLTVSSMTDSLVNSASDTRVSNISGDTVDTSIAVATSHNFTWGETRTYFYQVHNTGNAPDSIAAYPVWTFHGGCDSFVVSVGNGSDTKTNLARVGQLWPTTDSVGITMGEDATGVFILQVGAPGVAVGQNGDGDSITIRLVLIRDTAATGQYSGDNGKLYAEQSQLFMFDTVTIAGAVFVVTKSGTCTIGGVLSPAKPGATINYVIVCQNTGSGAGANVTIYDEIDTVNTTIVSYDTTSAGTGWGAQWGGMGVSDFSYGGAGWNFGAPDVVNTKWIRFRNVSVAAGSTARLYYRVTIN